MIQIETTSHDPFFNQAFEDYVFRTFREDEVLLLWRNRPAVVVGCYQNICREVHVHALLEQNIPVVRRMSGGNVQKVLVGREIASSPTVLMAAYPVRGLDINSSYTIYRLLNQQKENCTAVIFVGEDLDVLLELCDRILVLCGGKVSGIVDGRKTTKDAVGLMMTKIGG